MEFLEDFNYFIFNLSFQFVATSTEAPPRALFYNYIHIY